MFTFLQWKHGSQCKQESGLAREWTCLIGASPSSSLPNTALSGADRHSNHALQPLSLSRQHKSMKAARHTWHQGTFSTNKFRSGVKCESWRFELQTDGPPHTRHSYLDAKPESLLPGTSEPQRANHGRLAIPQPCSMVRGWLEKCHWLAWTPPWARFGRIRPGPLRLHQIFRSSTKSQNIRTSSNCSFLAKGKATLKSKPEPRSSDCSQLSASRTRRASAWGHQIPARERCVQRVPSWSHHRAPTWTTLRTLWKTGCHHHPSPFSTDLRPTIASNLRLRLLVHCCWCHIICGLCRTGRRGCCYSWMYCCACWYPDLLGSWFQSQLSKIICSVRQHFESYFFFGIFLCGLQCFQYHWCACFVVILIIFCGLAWF